MAVLKYKDKNGNFVVLPTGGGSGSYELPIASAETLGGIKIGENLTITEDGTLNAEASGSAILSPGAVIYDEQERIVGRWSDGRPVYQKTIIYEGESVSTTTSYNHNINNLDKVVNANVIAKRTGSDNIWETYNISDNNEVARFVIKNTTIDITLKWDPYNILLITLQYTKTTDELNSFRPDMIENISIMRNLDFSNIYSLDEKIIGCWVNGKPIYQKVINLSETVVLHSSVWTNIVMIENMEKIIDIECIRGNELNDGRLRWNCLNNYICGAAEEDNFNIRSGTAIILKYIKTTDAENSFTPDMIIDHENITDAEIEAAAAADKI